MERLLENKVEPIFLLNKKISDSDQDKLEYAWEELLRNNPHDSITGCSVDSVHQGMMNRFAKVEQVGKSLCESALNNFTEKINTSSLPEDSYPFIVINSSEIEKTEEKTVTLEVHRCLFAGTTPQKAYQECEEYLQKHPNYSVYDGQKQPVSYRVEKKYVQFGYDLPERAFRVPYMAAYVQITFTPTLPPFSWTTFYLNDAEEDQSCKSAVVQNEHQLKNTNIKIEVTKNGQLRVYDHFGKLGTVMNLVDTGDIGNEYIYRQSADNQEIVFDSEIHDLVKKDLIDGQKLSFTQTMMLPISADDKLKREEKQVIDITHRTAARSSMLHEFKVRVELVLMNQWHHVEIKIAGNNEIKDHRLQAVFDTGMQVATNDSDSIFEVVTRNNKVSKNWKNPENPQHEQAFVSLHNTERGIVVGNYGLNEYETNSDGSKLAITLLRCIGELGDWGYFPTKDSQCQGKFHAELSVQLTDASEKEQVAAYQTTKANQIQLIASQFGHHTGEYKINEQFLSINNPAFQVTATYVTPEGKILVRGYNLTNKIQPLEVKLFGKQATAIVNLLGEKMTRKVTSDLQPAEIRTYEFD